MDTTPSYHARLAAQLVALVGGAENILHVTHCTTRLRFQLKRVPIEAVKKVNALPEVISVMNSGGQFQIVIGSQVELLYQSVIPLLGEPKSQDISSHFSNLIDTVIAIFNPILWPMSAAGILKGLIVLFATLGWMSQDSGTYRILYSSADAVFFFLPILLGYSASKRLGGNPVVGIIIGCALVHPEIVNHVEWLRAQQVAGLETPREHFLGFPIQYLNYATSVIPIIFAVWFQARLERLYPKKLPDFVDKWLAPFCSLAITVPLTFLLIGPLSIVVANFISSGVFFLYHASPVIAGIFIGASWQVLVIFGIHWCLVPIALNNFAVNGYDLLIPLLIPAVFGQMGACIGVFLKTRHRKVRGYAGPAAMTAMFGITEPAIYGVTLPRKWPFIFGCAAASVGSGIIASFQTKAYSMGLMSLFSFTQLISPQGIDNTVIACVIATILTIILAAVLTYFFTPSEPEPAESVPMVEPSNATQTLSQSTPKRTGQDDVASPLSGEVIPLSLVSDPTFASGVMGEGIAIIPDSGTLVAPFAGTVSSVYKTQHAIGIKSTTGIELLIHIGIDTVKLDGQGFKLLVEQDQEVTLGEPLIEFDLNLLASQGFETTTPIIVANSADYLDVILTSATHVKQGAPLMTTL